MKFSIARERVEKIFAETNTEYGRINLLVIALVAAYNEGAQEQAKNLISIAKKQAREESIDA